MISKDWQPRPAIIRPGSAFDIETTAPHGEQFSHIRDIVYINTRRGARIRVWNASAEPNAKLTQLIVRD